MKIMVGGPGTGKTTRIKRIIREDLHDHDRILVLSFTNATVNDLTSSFKDFDNVECHTLHGFALKINHLPELYVLNDEETAILNWYSNKLNISFNELCDLTGSITYNRMIESCIAFIRTNKQYAQDNIGRLDFLIVDEFQDFNELERNLVFLLSKYASETLILGDDDQSIYEFKDADAQGLIDLYSDIDFERIPGLDTCYRCPDQVVRYSRSLITKNVNRIDKDWLESGKSGFVKIDQAVNHEELFIRICATIKAIRVDHPDSSIMILSPVRFYSDQMADTLTEKGYDFVNFWSSKLTLDQQEAIWWLNAVFGRHTILFLLFLGSHLKWKSRVVFMRCIEQILREGQPIGGLIQYLADRNLISKQMQYSLSNNEDIDDFFRNNPEFRDFAELLDPDNLSYALSHLYSALIPSPAFDDNGINIMTIHKSKGLQADFVFIIGLNDGVIPNEVHGTKSIEAWRRLLFVGMTRALKGLYLLSAVQWDGRVVSKIGKDKFKYDHQIKMWKGRSTRFFEEMNLEDGTPSNKPLQ